MTINLTDPIFTDEAKALAYFEEARWPHGPVCPHCGNVDASRIYAIAANVEHGVRLGLKECQDCHGQFTVRTGSVMESSHLPLTKWALAFRLMASAKKGISAHQMHRTLGVTYKTAWFLCHRIREAMRDDTGEMIGGPGKIVEADEVYIGGKPRKKSTSAKGGRGTRKTPVAVLVERDGRSRAKVISNVEMSTLLGNVRQAVAQGTHIMTDEWAGYRLAAHVVKGQHSTVNHGRDEFARGEAHVNTAESWNALLKRSIYGSFHHVSREHLPRYCDEVSFRWDRRGMDDAERAAAAIKAGEGKRLTYRPASATPPTEA